MLEITKDESGLPGSHGERWSLRLLSQGGVRQCAHSGWERGGAGAAVQALER